MNADTFLEQFETFAEAPNGVDQLRAMILQLAVQGKLVPQDPNDEPASVLASRIDSFFQKLESAKRVRRLDTLTPVADDWSPFVLPPNWIWRRLGTVIRIASGDGLTAQNMAKEGTIPVYGGNGVNGFHNDYNVENPTLVIGRVGFYCGSVHLTPSRAWVTDNAFVATFPQEAIDIEFLYWLLKGTNLQENDNATAQPVISGRKVYPTIVALPPLAEQKRIVAKVDQLMALCDELAARQEARRVARAQLVGATLDRLVSTRSAADLPPHVNRLQTHFDHLFDTPTTIPQLRQTILQLAVQGQLVPQDPNDEPARVLLDQIATEKAQLVSERKIRQPKTRSEDGAPQFDLPIGWAWAQAEDVCKPANVITYGILKPEWVSDGVPTVRVQDMKNGEILASDVGQCSRLRADKFTKTTLMEGDLLIAKDGATLGKTAFVPPSLAGGNVTQHVLRFPICPHVWSKYVRLVVDSPHGQAWMRKETRGVALPGVNVEDFRRMPLPLPPLAEQKRIVAKVTELLSLCDTLEAQLQTAESASTQLLSSAVANLLEAGAIR